MPELHSWEDEAARYLLGELGNVERADFEERLAGSPELRALVRELEEGAVALSMTSPRQLPPPGTWQRIEKGTASTRVVRLPASWIGWWRSGWAAAAACLIGWILYGFWVNRSASSNAGSATAHRAPAQPAVAESTAREERTGQPSPSAAIDPKDEMLATRLRTIERLRAQLRDLENQNTQLSRSFTQQQAMLAESSRLKFVQLAPPGNADRNASTRPFSPELQRVLFLAMARELGWITAETDGVKNGINTTDPLGVDFVDLRPGTNRVANPPEFQRNEAAANATGGGPNTQTPGGGIPAFVLGDSMVLALDTSMAPSGSVVTVSTGPVGQSQQPIGTMVLGDNPTAVIIPFASTSANGQTLTVTANSAGGSSVIGQISTSPAIHP
ncbi:MAG TPA: hypothetical protein VL793_03815 [Patescibacteria group bacterium]|jgi:anti-sigma-K factor RskA|nr:hypothetical protein [Patescibacteria group bacterium]